MKIAIYHNLPSGGAKRAVYEIVKRLAVRHQVDIYTTSTADHDFCDLRPYAEAHHIYPFEPLSLFESPLGRLNQWQRTRDLNRLDRLAWRIAADIDHAGYDIVFAHPCRFTQAPLILSYLETPSIYFCQEPVRILADPPLPRPYANGKGWRGRLDQFDPLIHMFHSRLYTADRKAIQSSKMVLVNSRYSQFTIEQYYGLPSQIAYLGVDTAMFSPAAFSTRDNYVLSVGALVPHKGFDFLIEALARIPPTDRPILHLIANAESPDERLFLESLAKDRGVRLIIEVSVPFEYLVDRYRRAQMVIYAPIGEPFGFVPLEAMACATAVVGVAEGGVVETVRDGETGILTPRDPAPFAGAICDLLASPRTAAEYGQAGRAVVERDWTWASSVAGIENFLTATLRT